MTKLVVDASVVIKWFVPEPLSLEARRILDGYRAGAFDLVAPDLLNAELGNIVWKKETYQGLGGGDASAVIEGFRNFGDRVHADSGPPCRCLQSGNNPSPHRIRLTLFGSELPRAMSVRHGRRKVGQRCQLGASNGGLAGKLAVKALNPRSEITA